MHALLLAAALAASRAPAPPVVLISIDGMRPDYVLEADRYGLRIPELRRLLKEGAHATAVTGVLPTVTYPSHTTLVTGVSPAKHGIYANETFDPLGKNDDGWDWYAEDIQVETLWDAAAKAGLVTTNADWPVTVGARIPFNIAQIWRASTADDAKLLRAVSTPGLLEEMEAELGPYPSGYAYTVADDEKKAAFSAWLLEKKHPRLHLCYFSGLDEESHESGPGSPATLAVLERLDAVIGRVRAAAERAGGCKATVVVVSDHGHARTDHELHLNEALREDGLLTLDGAGKITDWRAISWDAGGSAAIRIKDPADRDAAACRSPREAAGRRSLERCGSRPGLGAGAGGRRLSRRAVRRRTEAGLSRGRLPRGPAEARRSRSRDTRLPAGRSGHGRLVLHRRPGHRGRPRSRPHRHARHRPDSGPSSGDRAARGRRPRPSQRSLTLGGAPPSPASCRISSIASLPVCAASRSQAGGRPGGA